MNHIVTMYNNKGGVSKTTTVFNLAVFLAQHSKVLLVDCDPQCNATELFLASSQSLDDPSADLPGTSMETPVRSIRRACNSYNRHCIRTSICSEGIWTSLWPKITWVEHVSKDRDSGNLDFKDALQRAMGALTDVNEDRRSVHLRSLHWLAGFLITASLPDG